MRTRFIFAGIPPCDADPCNGHGTCENVDSGYTCTCSQAWVGDNCDTGNSVVHVDTLISYQVSILI